MRTYFLERDISRLLIIVIVAVLPFFGGCGEDQNPITDDHEEEIRHADADGFILRVDGDQVYRQFQGEHEGELTVPVGEEIVVHVSFLDDHGDEFRPGEGWEDDDDHDHDHDHESGEAEFALGLSKYDEAIIEIHLGEEDEDHGHSEDHHDHDDHDDEDHDDHDDEDHDDEDSGLSFEVEGLSAGSTEIQLQLLHGDHADYTASLHIPVTVE